MGEEREGGEETETLTVAWQPERGNDDGGQYDENGGRCEVENNNCEVENCDCDADDAVIDAVATQLTQ